MKHYVDLGALVPTCIVAMVVLLKDADLYSFAKRVLCAYMFFWFLSYFFLYLGQVVLRRKAQVEATKAKSDDAGDKKQILSA